jgi:hypothetical protein
MRFCHALSSDKQYGASLVSRRVPDEVRLCQRCIADSPGHSLLVSDTRLRITTANNIVLLQREIDEGLRKTSDHNGDGNCQPQGPPP